MGTNNGSRNVWGIFLVLVLLMGLPSAQEASAQRPYGEQPFEPASAQMAVDAYTAVSADQAPALVKSQVNAADSDGDGLPDTQEATYGTDPLNPDSDCDYLSDAAEVGTGASPADSDADGIIDALESKLADSNKNGKMDDQDRTSGVQFSCAGFKPFAIEAHKPDTSTLEVRIMGGTNVTAVAIAPTDLGANAVFFRVDGVGLDTLTEVQLYNDGTHGDRAAGDPIWTRNNFDVNDIHTTGVVRFFFTFNTLKVTANGLQITTKLTDVLNPPNSSWAAMRLGIIYNLPVAAPQEYGSTVQVTGNFVNIVDPLASLTLKGVESGGIYTAAKLFYHYYFDDYDFLFFFPDAPAMGRPFGYSVKAKNDVTNIGMNIFNNTGAFGSSGKLQNVLFLNFATNGPTLHEIMHRWGVSGLSNMGFSQCIDNAHWGIAGIGAGANRGGQLGGFLPSSLVPNPADSSYTVNRFGTNANGGDAVPYAPLELYLAGLVPASDVPEIKLPNKAICDTLTVTADFKNYFKTTNPPGGSPDGMQTFTMADVQAALGGARVPDATTAQKNFKAAFVMISARKLTAAEMAMFNRWAQIASADAASITEGLTTLYSFKGATGGMGTLDSSMTLPPARKFLYLPITNR